MSFKIIEQAPARLNRSELAVPGSQPQLFEKAASSAADVVFLDLEDAVAPDDKEQAGDRLDVIMIPKVGTASDVYAVDMLVTQIETAKKRKKKIGFELIIETALGMANVEEIARASKRNESLHFGVADYAASTRARTTSIGGPNPLYGVLTDKHGDAPRDFHWGDMWHYPISRMVVAARAAGLRPIDGP